MLNLEDIDKTILELEQHDTTYATCEKLSWLYIVRDHLRSSYKSVGEPLEISGSEFLEICSGAQIGAILSVLNEHMDVIKVLHPKEYQLLLQKIKDLK